MSGIELMLILSALIWVGLASSGVLVLYILTTMLLTRNIPPSIQRRLAILSFINLLVMVVAALIVWVLSNGIDKFVNFTVTMLVVSIILFAVNYYKNEI